MEGRPGGLDGYPPAPGRPGPGTVEAAPHEGAALEDTMPNLNAKKNDTVTMTKEDLAALVAEQVRLAQDAAKPQTSVVFEKWEGHDMIRLKGNFSKGGFSLSARKCAALFTDPIFSEVKNHLKGKGLLK